MQPLRVVLLTLIVVTGAWRTAAAQEIWVPNYSGNSVSVLDSNTMAVLDTIPIQDTYYPDSYPDAVALTPDRKFAYVTIDESDEIAVIDTARRRVVKYIQAVWGSLETQIYLSPLGDRFYVNNCAFPTVAVIDIASKSMVDVIDLPHGGTYGMAFSLDGTIGYAGNWSDLPQPDGCGSAQGVYVLDLVNNQFLSHIDTAPHDIVNLAVAPAGGTAIATTGNGTILAIDLSTGAFTELHCSPDPCSTTSAVMYKDATRAYVIDSGRNSGINTLLTLNTTDPLNPVVLHETAITGTTPTGFAWEGFLSGTRLFVLFVDFGAPSYIVSFDVSVDPPVQLPTVGYAGIDASEALGWWVPVPPSVAQGDIHGHGFVTVSGDKYQFHAQARERAHGGERGKLDLTIKHKQPHVKDDRFRSTTIESVAFSDLPGSMPGRKAQPTVDTVLMTGAGEWNGLPGYTFEATLTDRGESGKDRDTVAITIRDSHGVVMATLNGTIEGGNVQSHRVKP